MTWGTAKVCGVEDRVVGVLFGLAAGDRIGGPARMALEVAESLYDQNTFNPKDIGARYVKWWRAGAFDTGPTAARVLELGSSGMPLELAAIRVDKMKDGRTAGCNPAHRSAPLSMLSTIEDSRLDSIAKTEARLTHAHPFAGDASAAVVVLCRALIRGVSWVAALNLAATGRLTEIRRAIADQRASGLSRGGFAPDVLRSAIHFVDTSPSFSIALERSIDFAGDSNYSAVLAGSIGGARWGRAEIDEKAFAHQTSLLTRLRSVAVDLARRLVGYPNYRRVTVNYAVK